VSKPGRSRRHRWPARCLRPSSTSNRVNPTDPRRGATHPQHHVTTHGDRPSVSSPCQTLPRTHCTQTVVGFSAPPRRAAAAAAAAANADDVTVEWSSSLNTAVTSRTLQWESIHYTDTHGVHFPSKFWPGDTHHHHHHHHLQLASLDFVVNRFS